MIPENALIYRRVFPIDRDRIVVEEKWDLTHPDCPFIRNPWDEFVGPLGNRAYRQITMTTLEFGEADIPLKAPQSGIPGPRAAGPLNLPRSRQTYQRVKPFICRITSKMVLLG